jgi:hypothetical protein
MRPFDGMSATTGAGKPVAIRTPAGGTKAFAAVNWLFCFTGKLNAYVLSPNGIVLAP